MEELKRFRELREEIKIDEVALALLVVANALARIARALEARISRA